MVASSPLPERSRIRAHHVAVLATGLTTVVVSMWLAHGGLRTVLAGGSAAWSGAGQLSGLLASLLVLFGLALAGRPAILERAVGLDQLLVWHRYLGGGSAIMLLFHIASEVIARSSPSGFLSSLKALTGGDPYMALAFVGSLGMFTVTVTSLRSIRRRMTYETWYAIHLLAYVSLAIAFAHQLVLGADFVSDRRAWAFWVALNAGAFSTLIAGRWGVAFAALARPLSVIANREVAPGIHEISLTGTRLRTLPADSGQFAFLRVLDRNLWWQSHPFSLSSTPRTDVFKFTIKELGDSTNLITRLRPGTKVALEGPYGSITPDNIGSHPALLIAGGVGISPIKAILEELNPVNRPVILYRARSRRDLAHLDELQELAASRAGTLHVIEGRRDSIGEDPFSPASLHRVVPDMALRHVVVCGPESLIRSVVRSALRCGVPRSRIDHERSWW